MQAAPPDALLAPTHPHTPAPYYPRRSILDSAANNLSRLGNEVKTMKAADAGKLQAEYAAADVVAHHPLPHAAGGRV